MSPREAETLWRWAFAGDATAIPIASELDAIFRMRSATCGSDYLLRIVPAREARVVDLQAALLDYLGDVVPDLPVPRLCRNASGQLVTLLNTGQLALAMTFLPGRPLAALKTEEIDRGRIFAELARLDRALANFDHEAAVRDLLWDVSRADQVLSMVEEIGDADLRRLAAQALADWEAEVMPILPTLRQQILHNDFNPSNILVDANARVTGIIDFGDVVKAPLICDLATAVAYQDPRGDFGDLLAIAIDGYEAEYHLTPTERSILPVLVRARAAMVAAIAHWRSARMPANRDYLLRNVPAAARLLAAATSDLHRI
ncbi:phosphotransferase [Sphingomonas sp. CL5.1]|uniref:phosphotransferase n=1 Tax=Sphingomonas sp. CL5.1 TaxID=2653203 RepID=UPI00158160C0|nr:phosphotransferase [Sphingomonas sp. CL5.1]QKR99885.1 phosphotransferase [Sphingomonas sp. CL5.1]